MALTKAHNRMIEGAAVNVKDFGAVGDGVTDDTAAIQAAADYCVANGGKLYSEAGLTFYLASALDLKGVSHIEFLSNIKVNPAIAGVPVTIGGFATGGVCDISFQDITDGTSTISAPAPARPILRISGIKSSKVSIGGCNYIQVYSDDGDSSTGSNAYNDFYLTGATKKLELTDTGSFSWITENRFYGGRLQELNIQGVSYKHNHNKFYNNTFEGSGVDISFVNAHTNWIYGARFESVSGSTGVSFDSDTYNNSIIQTWSGVGNPRAAFTIFIPISDSGLNNLVTSENIINYEKVNLFSISPSTGVVSTGSDSSSFDSNVCSTYFAPYGKGLITPSIDKMSCTSFDVLALTDLIPVNLGDVFGFHVISDDTSFRPFIFIYDEDMSPILSEGSGGQYVSFVGTNFATINGRGCYLPSTNLNQEGVNRAGSVIRSEVKYIQLMFVSYAASTFKEVSAYIYCDKASRQRLSAFSKKTRTPVINGAPTQGYLFSGASVLDKSTSPATLRYVSYAHETLVNGALSAGATSVTVTEPASIANGDIVGILLDDGSTHWTSVSSLSTATFTIAAIPTGRSVADGARIVFNRWTT